MRADKVELIRVLVVDDYADAAEGLAMVFRLLGHDAQTAHRGREALLAARSCDFELIVLDLNLPDMSGYEVVRELRREPRFWDRFIIALSGLGRSKDIEMAMDAGFDAHFIKPIEFSRVQDMIRTCNRRVRAAHSVLS